MVGGKNLQRLVQEIHRERKEAKMLRLREEDSRRKARSGPNINI